MAKDPGFQASPPSPDFVLYLERITSASPNDPELEEDDLGVSWGHNQFQGAPYSINITLTSWSAIGSVKYALKFLAASVKTYRVAHFLCEKSGIKTDNLLSLCYLREAVEAIWVAWIRAHNVSNTNSFSKTSIYFCFWVSLNAQPASGSSEPQASESPAVLDASLAKVIPYFFLWCSLTFER